LIYDVLPVNNYSGNGLNTKFDFDFYIENEKQLSVSLFNEEGVKIPLVYNIDYSINEFKNENGSYIIFPLNMSSYGILAQNQKISLELVLPIVQETKYNNSSLLNLSALEYSFDYLTRLVQILARKQELSIKVEECSSVSPTELLDEISNNAYICTQKSQIAKESADKAFKMAESAQKVQSDLIEFQNSILNKTQITNCITEIPQRIKLDITNGILTFKAGTAVIIPKGLEVDGVTPKFDYVTFENDSSYSSGVASAQKRALIYRLNDGTITDWYVPNIYSGSGAPSSTQAGSLWFDTANNQYYSKLEGTWQITNDYSLPLGFFEWDGSKWTSNYDVFNGLGYIGSTVFVDKGVKYITPNGRNEDGSLNNIEHINEKMRFCLSTATGKNMFCALEPDYFSEDNIILYDGYDYIESEEQPQDSSVYTLWYQPSANLMKYHSTVNSSWNMVYSSVIGYYDRTNGAISNFRPKLPFRALDYNEKVQISSWAMPSNKYIDLTLGASGSSYTAPANGLFWAGGSKGSVRLLNDALSVSSNLYSGYWGGQAFIPVKKGAVVQIEYSDSATQVRFIYAEGEV